MGRWGRGQRGESCRPCTGSGASRRLRVYGELLLLHPSSPHGPVYTPYRRRQLRPELEIRPRSLEIRPSSHALPENAGEVSIGISNWK